MLPKKIIFTVLALLSVQTGCLSSSLNNKPAKAEVSAGLDVSCIGPESAQTFVVYLHGVDSVNPSHQEIQNRSTLQEIAKKENIRFAIPRAKMRCPNQPDSVCWGWKFDQDELSTILPLIMDSRTACFGKSKPFIVLGFSNGGYLLTRWYSSQMNPYGVDLPVSMIASGSEKLQIDTQIKDLSKNPRIVLIIGKHDQSSFDSSHSFFHQLRVFKAPVELIEFEGGHVLDGGSLQKAFRK